jgi:hypothetical protein
MRKRLIIVWIILSTFVITAIPSAHAATPQCFSETGYCIEGRIREFWEQNGGLAVFGFPIGNAEQITVDGQTVTAQRFERNRLELHPENARPYDVLLGRLGADRLSQQGRDWFTFPKSGDSGSCRVFNETGHAVCGEILSAWRKNGIQLDNKSTVSEAESIALFGLPLSGLVTETLNDGKSYQVQWFERARFEIHPENPTPYYVLLGLLGNEVTQPAQTTPPAPAPAPVVTGPGSPFVPLPKRMFASYMLEQMGYSNIEFSTQTWGIHAPFAQGLNDGSAIIESNLRDDLVQYLQVGGIMNAPNQDLIGMSYNIVEFSNITAAIDYYFDSDAIGSFWYQNDGIEYLSLSGCSARYSIGYNSDNILGSTFIMRCENKVLGVSVFGFGDGGQLGNLMVSIASHFASSFRW